MEDDLSNYFLNSPKDSTELVPFSIHSRCLGESLIPSPYGGYLRGTLSNRTFCNIQCGSHKPAVAREQLNCDECN